MRDRTRRPTSVGFASGARGSRATHRHRLSPDRDIALRALNDLARSIRAHGSMIASTPDNFFALHADGSVTAWGQMCGQEGILCCPHTYDGDKKRSIPSCRVGGDNDGCCQFPSNNGVGTLLLPYELRPNSLQAAKAQSKTGWRSASQSEPRVLWWRGGGEVLEERDVPGHIAACSHCLTQWIFVRALCVRRHAWLRRLVRRSEHREFLGHEQRL